MQSEIESETTKHAGRETEEKGRVIERDIETKRDRKTEIGRQTDKDRLKDISTDRLPILTLKLYYHI